MYKPTRTILTALSILLTSPAFSASEHGHKGHSHGEGTLEISVDKDQLVVMLNVPLDAATGFERQPRNDKEREALAQTRKILGDGAALFIPSTAAKCTLASSSINVPYLNDKNDKAKESKGAKEIEEEHADVEASYTFRCADPAALNSLETTIFRSFKRLYRLEAQRATPSGQGSGRLSGKQATLRW